MRKQLTMMVGVAMVAALALAGALGIIAFSGSQSVAAQTTSDHVIRSFSATQVAPDETVDVTITVNAGLGAEVTETLPDEWDYESASIDEADVTVSGQMVSFFVINGEPVTYTVTAPGPDVTDPETTFSGMFAITGTPNIPIGGDTMVTVGTGANGDGNGGTDSELKLSSKTAGAAVQVVLNVNAGSVKDESTDITVDLKKFGVPNTIAEGAVIIGGAYGGEPQSVTVNGNKVTLALYARFPGAAVAAPEIAAGAYTITFKQSAGITNPTKAGTATVEVNDGDDDNEILKEDIQSKVSLDKTSAARGTAVTVKGVGFNTGDATILLTSEGKNPDYRLVEATVGSDNTFEAVIDTTGANFVHGAKAKSTGDAFQGLNKIHVVDAAGAVENVAAYFEVTATLNPASSGRRGGKVKVAVADFAYGAVTAVKIGKIDTTFSGALSAGSGTITIDIPNNARLGQQEIVFEGSTRNMQGKPSDTNTDVAKSKITIGALDLAITPASAVIGQIIRIEGSGFADNECITRISVGPDQLIKEATSGDKIGRVTRTTDAGVVFSSCVSNPVESDGNGNLANSFRMPLGLKAGTYRVSVTSQSGRIGTTEMTVPKPSIELDIDESQRGSNVVVEGSDFPAEDTILVKYAIKGGATRTVGATTTDTIGRFRTTIEVPVNAIIGEEHEIQAESTDKADGNTVDDVKKPKLSAKTPHSIPDEILELSSDSAAPGQRLTLTASNLPLFAVVSVTIGGVGVAATDQSRVDGFIATDGTGSFTETVLVPQLTAGTHPVEVTAGRGDTAIQVIKFLDVVSVITRQSEDAFADLIENGTLTRVWNLDRASQTWSFFDPAPVFADFNTLSEVTSGQIVTIIMNAQDTFQGATLFAGSNPTAME